MCPLISKVICSWKLLIYTWKNIDSDWLRAVLFLRKYSARKSRAILILVCSKFNTTSYDYEENVWSSFFFLSFLRFTCRFNLVPRPVITQLFFFLTTAIHLWHHVKSFLTFPIENMKRNLKYTTKLCLTTYLQNKKQSRTEINREKKNGFGADYVNRQKSARGLIEFRI